jgi:predicted histidine transporter YuiF (NhaC family)
MICLNLFIFFETGIIALLLSLLFGYCMSYMYAQIRIHSSEEFQKEMDRRERIQRYATVIGILLGFLVYLIASRSM